ncbi:hypothetical protein ACIRFF_15655 [Streptomyces cyaneofuscatus]
MTELTGVFAAISARDSSDECRPLPGHAPFVQHCMTFETPAGTLLVQLDTTGTMPIPAAGETIVLHDQPVTVLTTETAYTRVEPGQPTIFTEVVVDTLDSLEGPLAAEYHEEGAADAAALAPEADDSGEGHSGPGA